VIVPPEDHADPESAYTFTKPLLDLVGAPIATFAPFASMLTLAPNKLFAPDALTAGSMFWWRWVQFPAE
jgi:hypothetical protein